MNNETLPLPWRVDTYRAALGHDVHTVRASNGAQVFEGKLDHCEAMVAAVEIPSDEAREQAHEAELEKWRRACEHRDEMQERMRRRWHDEVGGLTRSCHEYRERIEELESGISSLGQYLRRNFTAVADAASEAPAVDDCAKVAL